MPEKIFDILPPQEKIPVEKEPVKKRSFLKISLIFVLLLVVLGLIGSLFFSKVEIELKPEKETISLEETIIIDLAVPERDGSLFPGQVLEDEENGSKEFQASGIAKSEQKARGVITVYNAYSDSSRTLIPSRFVSADGKLFWSTKKVKIPGRTYNGGKVVPGQIDIEVEAAEPGSEYNIEATTFALPALAGTALYTTIYARSFSPMSGGSTGEVAQVLKEDLNQAQISLFEELKNKSKDSFKAMSSQGLVFLPDIVSSEIIEENTSKEADDIADSFSYDMKIKSQTIVFSKSDIDDFVQENLEIEENKIIKDLNINYSLKDTENDKLVLDIKVEAVIYEDIDIDSVKKAVAGKPIKEAELFLNNLTGIEKVDIKSWFLKRNIADDLNKIEAVLRVD